MSKKPIISPRIIAGRFRGRKLHAVDGEVTRPATDRTREGVFNMLRSNPQIHSDLEETRVLDLFAGTGSYGFEALSRGAKHCTFIESSPAAIRALSQSRDMLNLDKSEAHIIKSNILKLAHAQSASFKIAFLDPPYNSGLIDPVLPRLEKRGWIDASSLLVIEQHREDNYPQTVTPIEERTFGISRILFGKLRL